MVYAAFPLVKQAVGELGLCLVFGHGNLLSMEGVSALHDISIPEELTKKQKKVI
jgi:hypothetical protein